MKIELFVMDTLRVQSGSPAVRGILSYTDKRSRNVDEALETAWRITAAFRGKLSEPEGVLREAWDERAGGYGLSVGDFIKVDEAFYRVDPQGFTRLPGVLGFSPLTKVLR